MEMFSLTDVCAYNTNARVSESFSVSESVSVDEPSHGIFSTTVNPRLLCLTFYRLNFRYTVYNTGKFSARDV